MSFKTAVLFLVAGVSLWAQTTSISGVVTDPSGAAIPAARVQATPSAGGISSTTVTNAQGIYLLPALTAADYVVRVEAQGFAPAERTVTLLVGQVLTIDVAVKPASVSSTVDVTAEAVAVSTATSSVGGNIDPNQMKDLPLNGRNWMNLALMVPGVTSNDVDSNNPIGGVDGAKFQINVDGQQVTQNNSGSSAGQPRYSQDAIAEFQMITNRFDATQGRSLRAQINAETKTGTNTYHGTAFGYFRDNVFNASDPVAHTVLPYSDQQYGGTFGGKILKDKLWFFGSYEAERNPATIFATPTGFGGQTFSLPSLNNYREYLARFDYQQSDTSRFSLRMNGYTYSNPFTGVSGTAHPSAATSANNYSTAALLTWSKIISPAFVNEVKLGFNYFMYKNTAIVPSQQYDLPTVSVGGPYNYPKEIAMDTFSGRDDMFWNKGTHSIKAGGEYLAEFHHGYFAQNVRGVVSSFSSGAPTNLAAIFPVWNDPSTWNIAALEPTANTFVQGFGSFNYLLQRNTIGFWLQDDWKIMPKLTLNLGLRYDDDIGMLSTTITPPDGLLVPRHGQNHNFGPRIGFAYDVKGDHKTVIRGGAGLYYGDIEANQFYDQALFNGVTTIQASVESKPGVPINLFQPFGSITGAQFLNGTAPTPQQALQLVDPNIQTPYTLQASGGFERQVSANWTVSADYVFWRIYHEWERDDQNLSYDPTTGFNVNPTTVGRPNTLFTSIDRFITPDASGAIYSGLQMSVRRRFAKKWMFAGSYTLAKTKDSSGGAFYLPNNQFNLNDEWGNGTNDQRHTLNFNGAYSLPWGFQLSGAYHFGSGDDAGITSGSSPFANGGTNRTFLATAHVYDPASWNYVSATDPKYDLVQRNAFYGQPIHRVDLRLSKTFAIKERYKLIGIYEVFNVLNHANFGTYATSITTATFTNPAQNTNLEYEPRMMQLAARFEF